MTPETFESKFTLSVVQTMKVLFFFFLQPYRNPKFC